jgi:acetyl-CoA C-acetyltransferase
MVRWFAAMAQKKTPLAKLAHFASLQPGALFSPVISLLKGLTDPVVGLSMGQTAENLAWRFGITRAEMDQFAARSHQRALEARGRQAFGEIVPVLDSKGKTHSEDDGVREDSTPDNLKKLRPVFDKPYGNITAGNSSQVTDGAAVCLLASEKAVKDHGLEPIARILDLQWAGLDPAEMGLGPVHAATPILQRHGLRINDLDLWEINEAFAAQVMGCLRAWQSDDYCQQHFGQSAFGALDESRLNVDGGAISIGHPVGASGARIALHLAHALKQRGAKRGMAAICIGGGQGGALLLEAC